VCRRNDANVRRGTLAALQELGPRVAVALRRELFADVRHVRDANKERFTPWHNGVGVFVLSKK
jgi:hypothetical protein